MSQRLLKIEKDLMIIKEAISIDKINPNKVVSGYDRSNTFNISAAFKESQRMLAHKKVFKKKNTVMFDKHKLGSEKTPKSPFYQNSRLKPNMRSGNSSESNDESLKVHVQASLIQTLASLYHSLTDVNN